MRGFHHLVILFFSCSLYATDPYDYGHEYSIDSINTDLWKQIQGGLAKGNIEEAEVLLDSLYQRASRIEDKRYIIWAAHALGTIFQSKGENSVARHYFTQAAQSARSEKKYDLLFSNLLSLCHIERLEGNTDNAFKIMQEVAQLIAHLDEMSPHRFYQTKAYLFKDIGLFDSAYYYQQLQLQESSTSPIDSSFTYHSLSKTFRYIYNNDRAEEYALLALKHIPNGYDLTKTDILTTLASIKISQHDFDTALTYANEAKIYLEKVNHTTRLIPIYIVLADIFYKKGDLAKSNEYIEKIDFPDNYENHQVQANYYLTKLELNIKLKNKVKAQRAFNNARNILGSYNNLPKRMRWKRLESEYYTLVKEHQLSQDALANFHALKDSLNNLSRSYIIENLEYKFETEKKENEITRLELEDQLNQSQINQQRLAIGGLVGGLGLLSILLFRIFKQNKKIKTQNTIISNALSDKETLLQEIHHRVKNNLQVISSLLGIQSRQITDHKAKEAILEGRSRVHTMSLIHQNLYKKDNLTGIEMRDYLKKLSTSIIYSYSLQSDKIHIRHDIEDMTLDVDTVVPIGLITNELLTNSIKYAFPDNRKGIIKIILKEKSDHLFLSISDDGIGLDPDQLRHKEESFGHSLIRAFRKKLDATIDIDGANGTEVAIKINNYEVSS